MINAGDSEANYAYYALHKLKILPSAFAQMEDNEKAFIIASIRTRIEAEEKARQDAKSKAKKPRKIYR